MSRNRKMMSTKILFFLIASYLVGSIPFGLILTKKMNFPDLRKQGSGNIGATNVLRVGGKSLALLTLVLDIFKGALPTFMVCSLIPDIAPLVGFFSVLGHILPPWLKFQGGKGIATSFGVMLVLCWPIALVACCIWLGVVLLTRHSSLASLTTMTLIAFAFYEMGNKSLRNLSMLLTALAFFTHRQNIHRLLLRKELKIGEKEKNNGTRKE